MISLAYSDVVPENQVNCSYIHKDIKYIIQNYHISTKYYHVNENVVVGKP